MSAESPLIASIDDTIRAEMERWNVPGLAVGIFHDGAEATAGYGVANLGTGQPVVPETLFQIGSISKVFTATLVMALVDEGRLDLDTPVLTYLPDLPLADEAARSTIALRHLLTHTAGFYGDRFDDQGSGDDALARAVAAFGDLRQQTAPGELWTYCNAGFDLAGRVVEVVVGQPFETVMRERVFAPLGLERTTYFAHEAILHAVAVGHLPTDGDKAHLKIARPWPIPRRSSAAGAITSNVGELLRFARCHLDGGEIDGARLLSPAATRQMRTVQTEAEPGRSWGIGWQLRTIGETPIAEHGGLTNGFAARLTLVPDRRFALALLTNAGLGGAAHGKIGAVALERLLGLAAPAPAVVALPAADLAALAGPYHHDLADLALVVDGDGLRMERVWINPFSGERMPQEPLRLAPTGRDTFVAQGGDADGAIADVIRHPDGSVRFFRFGGRLAYPGRAGS